MSQASAGHVLAVVLAAVAVVATGCGDDGGKKDKDENTEPAAKTRKAKPVPPVSADAKRAFALLPADVLGVGGASFAKVRDSSFFAQVEPLLMQQAGAGLSKLEEACGIDPIESIDSVVGGVLSRRRNDVMVVIRGIERPAVEACAEKLAGGAAPESAEAPAGDGAKAAKKGEAKAAKKKAPAKGEKPAAAKDALAIQLEGDMFRVTAEGQSAWFMWLDDKTFFGGPRLTTGALEAAVVGGGDVLESSKTFMGIVRKVDTTGGFWAVTRGSEALGAPFDFDALWLSLDLFGGFAFDAGVRFADTAEAKEAQEALAVQLEGLEGSSLESLANKIHADHDGTDVSVAIELSDEEFAEFVELYKDDPTIQMVIEFAKARIAQPSDEGSLAPAAVKGAGGE